MFEQSCLLARQVATKFKALTVVNVLENGKALKETGAHESEVDKVTAVVC